MRILLNIESPSASVELPKNNNGKEWTYIKLIKGFWNQQNINTNRCLLININECESSGYYTTSNKIINYTCSYIQNEHYSINEYRLYNNSNEPINIFKNSRTDKITLNIYNYSAVLASDITSTNYLILEFELQ